jgi:two-component sensor histidine kinase
VLEIDNDRQHDYDQHDIDFLTGFANVLAAAVATASRTSMLVATIAEKDRLLEQKRVLIDEKDRLLEQKKVLAAELQHRVRNNLQLIYGMLSKQLDDTADKAGQKGIKSIALRVTTLAQVYDHLLGTEMTRTTDFGSYVKALCENLVSIQATPGAVTLACDGERVILDLDTVTAMGIVVAELVTNSYDHAFNGDRGAIAVSVRHDPEDASAATISIGDNGQGFVPEPGSKRQGIGLVKRLVQQVGGTSEMKSGHDGTLWTIRFPLVEVVPAVAYQPVPGRACGPCARPPQ